MASKPLPSPEVLRQLLRYEPETGKLFWRERGPEWFRSDGRYSPVRSASIWNGRYAGQDAFTAKTQWGYVHGSVLGVTLSAHRVAWAITTGQWPMAEIDHINMDRSDNRLCNLREATRSQNEMNKGLSTRNTSGHRGVSFNKKTQKWVAYIRSSRGQIFLGYFNKIDDAVQSYMDAAAIYHGSYSRI